MNKLLRKVLAVVLAATMAASAVPVLAAGNGAGASAGEAGSAVAAGMCSNVYTKDGKRIFAVNSNDSNFTSEITVSDYEENALFDAAVYAITPNGEALIGEQTGVSANGVISVDADTSKMPEGTTSIVTRLAVSGAEGMLVSKIPVVDYELVVPEKASADFWGVPGHTNGMHDPSIVKFDGDDTYYAYSSHHLIFTSKDLINWTRYDYSPDTREGDSKPVKEIAPITHKFVSDNYAGTSVNRTYWAPDVIYVEGDAMPYRMYISVSCGLGGRNSVIALVKSTSPLFWADAQAKTEDMGVVIATKDTAEYKTNAIDANIYTDANGNRYFIWGSFWGGIQGAKLTAEGKVEGINYTSDETILESSKNFGKAIFTQKNGVVGPEGAWMIENEQTGYRYMFTSYGWLGSNYNTRVARSPLSTDFADVLAAADGSDNAFVDANGVKLDVEYTAGSDAAPTGYKLIGSYRLGDGGTIMRYKDWNYYLNHSSGDANIYYGPGHNSAIKAADGDYYYVSHVRKNGVEGGAYLQVRKMLFTEDGWPIVSPVAYTGEKEQKLPVELIYGTYDFATVGYTKSAGTVIGHRTNDLPVMSSKVTLLADGTLADELGTWEYDGDHTLTITFAKDGDTKVDEFYKSGDVVTMKALLSYDRDAQKYVMALTGTDQNAVTQFATKPMEQEKVSVRLETTPIVIEKSKGNPVLGFDENGDMFYGGDPAALVDGDTVYIYVGHDTAEDDSGYKMPEWACYSSKDMVNWNYEGVVMKATDIAWRNDDTSAWASQAVKYGDKYYLYYCTWDSTSEGKQSIGVAVSDSPTGGFVDIGAPLVKGTDTAPETSGWNDIDPTVWIETDSQGIEHRYLAWGNGKFYMCELKESMTEVVEGSIKEQGIMRMGFNSFTEGPWLYRRQDENGKYYGQYYVFFAQNWREEIGYAVTDDISSGKWTYKGKLMAPSATSNTNHPSVIDFKGKTYFIYHNGALERGSGFRRSVCIQELVFDEDGDIYALEEMSTGISGTAVMLESRNGRAVAHEVFANSPFDADYPIIKDIYAGSANGVNGLWEIVKGLYEPENENYVSIQAVNKPGLYINADGFSTVLMHNTDGEQDKSMTFKTVAALDGGEGISFESVYYEGRYLAVNGSKLVLSDGSNAQACSFTMDVPFLSDCYASDETVSFKMNNGTALGDVTIYVAEYENGVLSGVGIEKATINSDEQKIEIAYTKQNENNVIKVFLWDEMTPVAHATEVLARSYTEVADNPSVPEGYTSYFGFENNLADTKKVSTGELVGPIIWNADQIARQLTFEDGYNGKALRLFGAQSYGVRLGRVICDSTYTVSFRFKANEFTACTAGLFLDVDGDPYHPDIFAPTKWVSMPVGWAEANTDTADKWKLKVWSMVEGENPPYKDCVSGFIAEKDTWYQVTVVAEGATAKMYIDGKLIGSGPVADVVNAFTTTYIGVNYWDTPFNGLIDDLYIYDGQALTEEQIKQLYTGTANTAE